MVLFCCFSTFHHSLESWLKWSSKLNTEIEIMSYQNTYDKMVLSVIANIWIWQYYLPTFSKSENIINRLDICRFGLLDDPFDSFSNLTVFSETYWIIVNSGLRNHGLWVKIPRSPLTNCATLRKLFSLWLSFLICKMVIIIVPTSWSYSEY